MKLWNGSGLTSTFSLKAILDFKSIRTKWKKGDA